MNFTADWFTHNIPNFRLCMQEIGDERKEFLEIGSYEGRATCWMLENALPKLGVIFCVDPFPNMPEVEQRFWDNTRSASKQQMVVLVKSTSYWALADFIVKKKSFDFIYVDGNHAPDMALTDACMAWGLLRSGGVMLFDDYEYPEEPTKRGIDAFLTCFDGQFDIVLKNYQLAVKKR